MTDAWLDADDGQGTENLPALDCPTVAAITQEAIVVSDDDAIREALESCDDRFYENDEPIADRLFARIAQYRSSLRIGRAS